MSKGHRDNHAVRKKIGPEAFDKKKKRRAAVRKRNQAKCAVCGNFGERVDGTCLICRKRLGM